MAENQIENKEEKKKRKSVSRIVSTVIMLLCVAILLFAIILRVTGKNIRIFGYTFHFVVTASMAPEIKVGDFILSKEIDELDVVIGNYIVFKSPDPSLNNMIIIHSVVDITYDDDGNPLFTTKGVNPIAIQDPYQVKEVMGIYAGKCGNIWYLGFIVIGIVFGFIIFRQIRKIVRIYKEEKAAADK